MLQTCIHIHISFETETLETTTVGNLNKHNGGCGDSVSFLLEQVGKTLTEWCFTGIQWFGHLRTFHSHGLISKTVWETLSSLQNKPHCQAGIKPWVLAGYLVQVVDSPFSKLLATWTCRAWRPPAVLPQTRTRGLSPLTEYSKCFPSTFSNGTNIDVKSRKNPEKKICYFCLWVIPILSNTVKILKFHLVRTTNGDYHH